MKKLLLAAVAVCFMCGDALGDTSVVVAKRPGAASFMFSETWDSGTPPSCWPCKDFTSGCCASEFDGWVPRRNDCDLDAYATSCGISTTQHRSAPNSYKMYREAGGLGTCSVSHATTGSPPIVYVRFYLWLGADWADYDTPGGGQDELVHFLFTNTQTSMSGFRVNLMPSMYFANRPYPYMFFLCQDYDQDCGGASTHPTGYYNLLDHLQEWIAVEFKMDTTNNLFSVWINGTLLVDNHSVTITDASFNTIIFDGWANSGTPFSQHNATYYVDDIVVATSYIGP